MSDLISQHCTPCEGGTDPLSADQVGELLPQIPGWLTTAEGMIARRFEFDDFHQTMAFVNAIAWIAHRENHHPDLAVGYNSCNVSFITHAIGGLSENDFICAAKINRLTAQ